MAKAETKVVHGDNEKPVDGKKLLGFVEKLEKLNNKKEQVLQEIREEYADAKSIGFDGKTIRKILKLRKTEPEKTKEEENLLTSYKAALNMLDDEE